MSDSNPVNQEVEQFNKQKLKKTNTQEKNHLPTKEGSKETEESHESPSIDPPPLPARLPSPTIPTSASVFCATLSLL
uniref:Thymosin beta 1 n=1 Tax=Maylandia zebra TaxID=106582 RepID=A0A3P9BYX3_9CICH